MLGFQDQEAWTLVEKEERSVRIRYASTGVFASVQDSTSTKLQRITSSSKSSNFKLLLQWRFKMIGFQDQEDGSRLVSEERSVRYWYVSTTAHLSVTYSTSTKLQRITSSSKSSNFKLPFRHCWRSVALVLDIVMPTLCWSNMNTVHDFQHLQRKLTASTMWAIFSNSKRHIE